MKYRKILSQERKINVLWAKWHKDKTHTQETDKDTTPARGEEMYEQGAVYFHKAALAEFQTAWLSLLSTAHVHKCYRRAKGSEIPFYCRVCPEPFFPPYHRKGMFPRLQGTIKLKAVSRLLGRMPRLQAHSAWADRPVCRHISATLLNLQKINAKYDCIRCVYLFNFTSEYNCLRHGRNAVMWNSRLSGIRT